MSSTKQAREIFSDALEASLPKHFISKYCSFEREVLSVGEDSYDLSQYKNIYVFGSGKAAATMALEIEKLLNEKIHKGLVVSPKTELKLNYIEICEGSHPLPDAKSLDSATKLLAMMQECEGDDFYIYLLSGGSSALIELPIAPINLDDFQDATQIMLHNALEIQDINVVRKHISKIKGGRLAQACSASGVVLVLSDIIGDDLHSIGSAPLYADKSSYNDAREILESKAIFESMPQSVQEVLERGLSGGIEETPKEPNPNVKHYVIASNALALNAAAQSAEASGLSVKVVDEPMQGDVVEMMQKIVEVAESSSQQCILFGGECTVKVSGSGQGGRNQHMVALMLQEICSRDLELCFLSAGTDGIDGNSDATGAVVSLESCKNLKPNELQEHIENFDSYNLFKKTESLIITGPSGTNVIDLAILIKGEQDG
jgi:glycerate 2-kinase